MSSRKIEKKMCTLEKRGRVYILTLTGDGDEHRLNSTLLSSIRSALARLRSAAASGGAALVTTGEGKFFSNGYDLAWARSSPDDRPQLMDSLLQRTVADLLSLPMPTIAAVTGHASAAGLILALSHDNVLMRSDRGFLYMSELDKGVTLPAYFNEVLRAKIGDPRVLRDVVMRASKIPAVEAVRMGIVDRAVGGAGETVEAAVRLGEELAGRGWDGSVYATIRKGAFPELTRAVGLALETWEENRQLFLSKL